MANDDIWKGIGQTDGTQAQSFEFLLAFFLPAPLGRVVTADIVDVNPAFTAKNRARNTYGAKGQDRSTKYADNLVLTWSHEIVRDQNGQFQPELKALLKIARALGADNRCRIQSFDALGGDDAYDATYALAQTRNGTGWDDATWIAFTATQYAPTGAGWVTNPVLTGNVPLIRRISPTAAVAGSTVYLEGDNFTGVTTGGVKFGATAATNIVVINDELISCTVPAGSAGTVQVTVTSPIGTSANFAYTRGA